MHNQSVTLPLAHRVSVPGRLRIGRQWAAIRENLPVVDVVFTENHHQPWRLHDLSHRGQNKHLRPARGNAGEVVLIFHSPFTQCYPGLWPVRQVTLQIRAEPDQQWIQGKIAASLRWQIAGGLPDPREIRDAMLARSRRGQIRLAVSRPRCSRRGVMNPLCNKGTPDYACCDDGSSHIHIDPTNSINLRLTVA